MINGIGNKVFILGIGGISLSAMAHILLSNGHEVSGYDQTESSITRKLNNSGINVTYKESDFKGIINADTVIYTSAISEESKAMVLAKSLNKQILSRAKALGLISNGFNQVIAVAGSHGKTTTSAMISTIFDLYLENFTAHVGGEVVEFGSNLRIKGNSGLFVTEACEYKRNFLTLSPTIGVILNLDLDHTDVYASQEDMIETFIQFSNKIVTGGTLILNIDAFGANKLLEKTNKNKRIITYSLTDASADYYISHFEQVGSSISFEVAFHGESVESFVLPSFFEHNLYNALAAIISAKEVGLEIEKIKNGISKFQGVRRRFEKIGSINGADIVLDYAHHPEELSRVLTSTKAHVKGKVFAIFQPHTYTRTKYFWREFIKSLSIADSIVLYPIFPAREKPINGVSSKRMAEDLRRINKICYYSESASEIMTYLSYFVKSDDIVLVLGAGDLRLTAE